MESVGQISMQMLLRKLAFTFALFCLSCVSQACPVDDLGAFLVHEGPRVVGYIEELETSQNASKLDGIELCDGTTLFRGWVYFGKVKNVSPGQHIHLFAIGKARRAVAWVEKGAKPLTIPACPSHLSCAKQPEGAEAISGDIYSWKQVQPGDSPAIIVFPLRSWFGS